MKYLNYMIAKSSEGFEERPIDIPEIIEKFRRLKYRVDKRYRKEASEELLFSEHNEFKELISI